MVWKQKKFKQFSNFDETSNKFSILQFNFTEAPETLVSILKCLGETMTVHVACTTWDKQFRLALVASSLPVDYQFESQEFYSKKTRVLSRFYFNFNSNLSLQLNI